MNSVAYNPDNHRYVLTIDGRETAWTFSPEIAANWVSVLAHRCQCSACVREDAA